MKRTVNRGRPTGNALFLFHLRLLYRISRLTSGPFSFIVLGLWLFVITYRTKHFLERTYVFGGRHTRVEGERGETDRRLYK